MATKWKDQTNNNNPSKQQPASLAARKLASFPEPDLEVVVGPKDRIYRYHALILACHSGFVDRILSSPMGIRNQEQKRIEFPDIEEETWEKMIAFLEPGGVNVNKLRLEDMEQVLPFYEKYQFSDGLNLLDTMIPNFFSLGPADLGIRGLYRPEPLVELAVMCHNLSHSLPESSKAVVRWTAKVLKKLTPCEEKTIQVLLPIVENDEEVLTTLVKMVKGRHYRTMTIDEMRSLTRSENFPRDILMKSKQIKEVEEILKNLHVEHITLSTDRGDHGGGGVDGTYEENPDDSKTSNRGAMQFVYQHTSNRTILIEAMDPFGLVWEIAAVPDAASICGSSDDEEEDDDEDDTMHRVESTRRVVFYRWDSGYSSPIPPKHGWHSVEAEAELRHLDYKVEKESRYY